MYRNSKLVKTPLQEEKVAKGCPTPKKNYDDDDDMKTASKFRKLFGFEYDELKTWDSFIKLLYRPTDPASLGTVRFVFGYLMFLDIPEERGLAQADIRWGDPLECRFPLFDFLQPLRLQWMCIVYFIMWLGSIGLMLGLFFRVSCCTFVVTYWYIFLLDKSSWNNHSYLYGLIATLLIPTKANQFLSVDILRTPEKYAQYVPLWNYAILKFQLFVLYFFAGLKKLDSDWLHGYSMTNLSNHPVFIPFKYFLTTEQVDFWVVHLGGFLLDLTIGFWLFFDKTRVPAIVFCSIFHFMNSILFTIGMFPYVCLATMPLFCSPSWPRRIMDRIPCLRLPCNSNLMPCEEDLMKQKRGFTDAMSKKGGDKVTWKHKLVVALLATHVGAQVFLPYSHFITKGYNNWTNGLYGYSWDMMVHTWDTVLVMPRVVDHATGQEHYLGQDVWVQSDRWSKHSDMVIQWAHCIQKNLKETRGMHDISIYLDLWSSLNGRFQQRMYDPHTDLLKAEWSAFSKPSWVMPLLMEFSDWREKMTEIEKHVFSWSNHSSVLFIADFPGLSLENFIAGDLGNVSLTVLDGEVVLEQPKSRAKPGTTNEVVLTVGESAQVTTAVFHRVHTVSTKPACYMYTYVNETAMNEDPNVTVPHKPFEYPGVFDKLIYHIKNIITSLSLVWNAILNTLFSVPVPRRVRVNPTED